MVDEGAMTLVENDSEITLIYKIESSEYTLGWTSASCTLTIECDIYKSHHNYFTSGPPKIEIPLTIKVIKTFC